MRLARELLMAAAIVLVLFVWSVGAHFANIALPWWPSPKPPTSPKSVVRDWHPASVVLGDICGSYLEDKLLKRTPDSDNDENSRYSVGCQDNLVSHIERFWPGGVSIDTARSEVRSFMPPDAELKESSTTGNGQPSERYHSSILVLQFHFNPKTAATPKPSKADWRSYDVLVIYHTSHDHVTSVEISVVERQ